MNTNADLGNSIRHEYEKKIAVLEEQVRIWKGQAICYGWALIAVGVTVIVTGLLYLK